MAQCLRPGEVGVKSAKNTPTFEAGMPQSAVYGRCPRKVGVIIEENTPTCGDAKLQDTYSSQPNLSSDAGQVQDKFHTGNPNIESFTPAIWNKPQPAMQRCRDAETGRQGGRETQRRGDTEAQRHRGTATPRQVRA